MGAVNTDRDAFKAFMKEVREKLDKILERQPPPPTTAPGSPVQLTEFGEHVSRNLGVRDWALNEATALLVKVEGKEPYEVHDLCIDHVQTQFDIGDEFYVRVRAGAYEHGTDVKQVRNVFAIELRDALLRLMETPA